MTDYSNTYQNILKSNGLFRLSYTRCNFGDSLDGVSISFVTKERKRIIHSVFEKQFIFRDPINKHEVGTDSGRLFLLV